jgi:hypothetical protein
MVVNTSAFSINHYRQKAEAISGQIVAYSNDPLCWNGNGYWSMVIRVQQHKHISSRLIRVDFSYPCGKSPDWVWAQSQVKKFRLYRQRDYDAALEGELLADAERRARDFQTKAVNDDIQEIPYIRIWKYPPGIEPFTLPFGQILPCYHSLDLPYLPVL